MRMNLVWSDELTEQLAGMADLDAIAPEMLTAAAPIATDALKQRVRQHRSSRADKHLADSVRAGKPKKRKKGGYGLEVVECVPIKPPGRVVPLREAGVKGSS